MKKGEKTKTSGNKIDRHVGVIVEHIDHKFNLLADQYLDIDKKLDEHTAKLDEHTAILDKHTAILDKHTAKLDEHTAILEGVQNDIRVIKQDVGFMKIELKLKVDVDQFAALERRVAFLEKRTAHK